MEIAKLQNQIYLKSSKLLDFLVYYKVLGTNILQLMLHTEGTKLIKHQYCSEKAIFDM